MSFSSGTFSLVAGNPVVTGTTISSTVFNNTMTDIATGLSTCVLKDGTQTTTVVVPFAQGISLFGYATGTWTTPSFSAGNFTASGSMTWTVAAGDVAAYAYTIANKLMTVIFTLNTTSIGGTPSTTLSIAIPASKTATKSAFAPALIYDNSSSVASAAYAKVDASGTTIDIGLIGGGNLTGSTDLTYVRGQITFEID